MDSPKRIRLLSFTTLYPDVTRPRHGIFVETRLRRVIASGNVETIVVAPVPWFPSTNPRFGEFAAYARVPRYENRHGIAVHRPRYPLLPKVGMTLAPFALAFSGLRMIRQIMSQGYDFDMIDAHYFYPDGVAAALIGKWLAKPVVITARGTDINLIPRYRLPRRMIQWAAARADAIVCVCAALESALLQLGASSNKTNVLRNGVDLELFKPIDRERWRNRLGLTRPTLISVGHLIERKGHHIAIEALASLPHVQLMIVGDGEEDARLRRLASQLGVVERVTFVGPVPQDQLKHYYGAADALVLASSREGWANVLLEAMACGTPVVATAIWGTPEVVATPEAGVLMAERSAAGLVRAYERLTENYPERAATRRYAERFSWDETVEGQQRVFEEVINAAHDRD